MRYEVPAVIVLDAADHDEAVLKALGLGATLDKDEGPGAFFSGITTAAVAEPILVSDGAEYTQGERERAALDVSEHAEALQHAAGYGLMTTKNHTTRSSFEASLRQTKSKKAKLALAAMIKREGEADAHRHKTRPCGFCASAQPTGITHCGECGAFLRTPAEARESRLG